MPRRLPFGPRSARLCFPQLLTVCLVEADQVLVLIVGGRRSITERVDPAAGNRQAGISASRAGRLPRELRSSLGPLGQQPHIGRRRRAARTAKGGPTVAGGSQTASARIVGRASQKQRHHVQRQKAAPRHKQQRRNIDNFSVITSNAIWCARWLPCCALCSLKFVQIRETPCGTTSLVACWDSREFADLRGAGDAGFRGVKIWAG